MFQPCISPFYCLTIVSFFSWQAMQNDLSDYRNKIEGALEMHAFNRDVDEVKERLNEKVSGV